MRDLAAVRETLYHPVEGGAVVFHAARRKLFALNETAAFIWSTLQDAATPDEALTVLHETAGIPRSEAERWIDQVLLALKPGPGSAADEASGRATIPPPIPIDATGEGSSYTMLERTFRVLAPAAAIQLLEPLLGRLHLPSPADNRSPDVVLRIRQCDDGGFLVMDGEVETAASAATLTGIVEQAVVQNIVPLAPHILTFHAALLRSGDNGLLLPAPSGSGKSTLSIALERGGWRYGSDELALLRRDGRLQGIPLPPCIKAENFATVERWHPLLAEMPEQERFSRKVKFVPLAADDRAVDVSNVVLPMFSPGAATCLEPMPKLNGLAELLSQCVYVPAALEAADVDILLSWHSRLNYWRLPFGDSAAAVRALADLA